jgi:hypothetical protein
MRLLVGLLGAESLESQKTKLKSLLEDLLKLSSSLIGKNEHPVMANIFLCLAELATALKLQVLGSLQNLTSVLLDCAKSARTPGEGQSVRPLMEYQLMHKLNILF